MIESLKVNARTTQFGCGVYEVDGDCYVRLFITDGGRVIPINRGPIHEDDLMQAYQWGRLEEMKTRPMCDVDKHTFNAESICTTCGTEIVD